MRYTITSDQIHAAANGARVFGTAPERAAYVLGYLLTGALNSEDYGLLWNTIEPPEDHVPLELVIDPLR